MTEITIPQITHVGGVLILCVSLALNIITTYLFHQVTKPPTNRFPLKTQLDQDYLYPRTPAQGH